MRTYNVQQTKNQLLHSISRYVSYGNTQNWLGPLNDENKQQVDETKTEKFEKFLIMYIINLMTIRYRLIASGNIIHSILNC